MTTNIKKNIISEYNLQDYILDDHHIEKALQFKMIKNRNNNNNNNDFMKKEKHELSIKKNNDFFIPSYEDTLFWCYFIIVNGETAYETLYSKNALVEKQFKIDFISLIRKNKDLLKIYKFDTITNIESNLANDNFMNIKTCMALCAISNINVIYIKKNTFFELFMNDTDVIYVVKEDLSDTKYIKKYGFQITNKKNSDLMTSTMYKIDKLDKPIKAISSYKVEDLLQICKKLEIETINKDNGKTKSKMDLYTTIIQHF
jgi:hypothetical protein